MVAALQQTGPTSSILTCRTPFVWNGWTCCLVPQWLTWFRYSWQNSPESVPDGSPCLLRQFCCISLCTCAARRSERLKSGRIRSRLLLQILFHRTGTGVSKPVQITSHSPLVQKLIHQMDFTGKTPKYQQHLQAMDFGAFLLVFKC